MKTCPLCLSGLPPTTLNRDSVMEHGDDEQNTTTKEYDYDDDDNLEETIAVEQQQNKKHKKKKKKKHSDNHRKQQRSSSTRRDEQKSPRSRPRSPSPQSPYRPRRHYNNKKNDQDDDNNGPSAPRKLVFDQNNNETATSSPPTRPTHSPSQQHSSSHHPTSRHYNNNRKYDTEDFEGRKMNGHAGRQFVEKDSKERYWNEEGGGLGGGSVQQQQHHRMDQGGGRRSGGNHPSPDGYYDTAHDGYDVKGTQQQQQQQQHQREYRYENDGRGSSVGSYRSSDFRQSEVSNSSQGSSHYSSAAERAISRSRSRCRRQNEEIISQGSSTRHSSSALSVGSHYSGSAAAQSHHDVVDDTVSDDDDEGSYSSTSSDEESFENDNETDSNTGSHVSFREELSVGSFSHHGRQQQSEWTSLRRNQQVNSGGGISQQHHHHQEQQQQQWTSPQYEQQQHQQSQSSVRPNPQDYHEYHPNQTSQLSAAERMMRHRQYNTSPSPPLQHEANPRSQSSQSPQQAQFDGQEEDESDTTNNNDDNDENDEREVLEPEDVSIISMNSSASRNLLRAKLQKRREAGSKKHEQDPDDDDDYDDDDERPIKTFEYDQKGRCVRHPHVRLRKKKMIKGWVTLLSNCPECCLDEMKRVKKKYQDRVCSPGGGNSVQSNSVSSAKKKKKKKKKKKSSSQLPPITQLNVSHNSRGSGVDDSSTGTASTFTIASSSNTSGRWQNYLTCNASVASAPTPTTARVTRLPYNDQYNGNGWYTGQVSMAGIPNGWGMMNYANGHTFEGEWRNGVSVTKTREAPPALGKGGEGNFYNTSHRHYPSHHQDQAHSSSPHEQRRGGSAIDPPVSRRQMTQLEPLRESPSRSIPSRSKFDPRSRIVSNMPYRDNRGFVIGAYTGEVDEFNVPNGIGKMRYNDGFISDGRWIDGELDNGYNVTDDEDGDDDASCRSRGARSVPGITRYHYDGYQQNSNTSTYPRQNLESKLSSLEAKLSTMEFNGKADWRPK